MMEDWTDIIGEELENIEEPLPADDWSVLQQKYAAAQKKKRAVAFEWAGGITSVAAAVALVMMIVRPDSSVIPDSTGDLNDFVAEVIPPTEENIQVDSVLMLSPVDTVTNVAPSTKKRIYVPVDLTKNEDDDEFIAENHTEEITSENTEEVLDVIRDTTSLKDKLFADASTTNKRDSSEDAYTEPTGTFGLDYFRDDDPRRRRRPVSIGISGSTSDSPIFKINSDYMPDPPMMEEELLPPDALLPPDDSLEVETPQPAMAMMRAKSGYSDSYQHEIPVSVGLSARFFLTDRLSINTGLNYTRYKSLRTRWFAATCDQQKDWQYVHYLGIPVRLDWVATNSRYCNFYIGAGMQMDKCVYAEVGNERLHEKQLLFGLNGTMGLQVNIVPKVGLYFEPEVYYALNEGTIETFRYDEAFVITVRGGLRFKF